MKLQQKHIYQNKIFDLLDGHGVRVHFELKQVLGSTNAAIWLSQILYWYDKGESTDYIRKSRSELEKEISLTRIQQELVERKLIQLGVVSIKVLPGRPSLINHITVHMDVLVNLIANMYKTRTSEQATHDSKNEPSTSRLSTHQSTEYPQNISKTTQENIQRLAPLPSTSQNYVSFQEMGEKLKRKESIQEYKQ